MRSVTTCPLKRCSTVLVRNPSPKKPRFLYLKQGERRNKCCSKAFLVFPLFQLFVVICLISPLIHQSLFSCFLESKFSVKLKLQRRQDFLQRNEVRIHFQRGDDFLFDQADYLQIHRQKVSSSIVHTKFKFFYRLQILFNPLGWRELLLTSRELIPTGRPVKSMAWQLMKR